MVGKKITATRLTADEIVYIKCNDYVTTVFLFKGGRLTCVRSLRSFMDELDGFGFLQINSNILVNGRYIDAANFSKDKRTLTVCGETLPVSRRRLLLLRAFFAKGCT